MKRILFIFLFLILAGCVTTNYSSFSTKIYPPTAADQVKVYQTKMPELPYDEIGMIEAEGARADKISALINSLRQKAAENGADAIILLQSGESIAGFAPIGGMLVPINKKNFQATAIKFKK